MTMLGFPEHLLFCSSIDLMTTKYSYFALYMALVIWSVFNYFLDPQANAVIGRPMSHPLPRSLQQG
jgi:hypothetical protein